MCEFDLCEVGGLKDPENGLAMRKRLVVVTTSPAMFQALHGRTCRKQHAHQVIEGQTHVDGQLVRNLTLVGGSLEAVAVCACNRKRPVWMRDFS